MNHARPLLLIACAVASLMVACSQPDSLKAPNLKAQFGTAVADTAVAVVAPPSSATVYVAGEQGRRAYLRQYSRNGRLNWERSSSAQSRYIARVLAADVDAQGNIYLAWDYTDDRRDPFISKLNRSGTLLWRKSFSKLYDMDVDDGGNIYTAGLFSVRKYSTGGELVWERNPDMGAQEVLMRAVAVSPSGNVVAVGTGEPAGLLVKYTNAGGEVLRTTNILFGWGEAGNIPGDLEVGLDGTIALAYTGSFSEGTADATTLEVFDDAGARLWYDRIIQDRMAVPGVDISRTGSIYLTTGHWVCDEGFEIGDTGDGVTCTGGSDSDPERSAILTRKYTTAGEVVWSRVLNRGRHGKDESTGVSVRSDDELYIVGNTVNKVNGVNAGEQDAFVARLNEQGRLVWSR